LPPLKEEGGKPKPEHEKKQKTEAQKIMDGTFAKAKYLKSRLDTVQSKYLTLNDALLTDEAWDWAKSSSLQNPIKMSRQKVEDLKKVSGFWATWFMCSTPQFATGVKKSFNTKQIEAEFKQLPTLENHINDFEKAVFRVIDMHRA
jgi:hypothetical protein